MYAQQYVENDLIDKSPVELVRLLYSKAIEKLDVATRHTRGGDIRERNACLARAMEIVAELQGSLNLEAGGEVALELARIYDYVQRRMIEAAGNPGSVAELKEARLLLANLCEGWNDCDPPPAAGGDEVGPEAARPEQVENGVEETEEDLVEELTSTPGPTEYSGARESRVWTL